MRTTGHITISFVLMKQERSDSDKKDSANVELRNENLCPFISPLKQKSATGDKQQISKSVIFKCYKKKVSQKEGYRYPIANSPSYCYNSQNRESSIVSNVRENELFHVQPLIPKCRVDVPALCLTQSRNQQFRHISNSNRPQSLSEIF